MENGMNGDEYRRHHSRSRSPSPSLNRSNSRGSMNRDGRSSSLVRRNAKQIRFYRNGDKFFRGLKLAVSAERYKEFDALCAELSSKLDLPSGAVRFIFEAESGKEVRDVSELEYGSSYCCGSAPSFKAIPGGYGRPHHSWSVNSKNPENKAITNWDRKVVQCQQSTNKDFIKPKLVTIIKNGKPPQKKVTMLLNQKTALHLDQVLDHLSAKGTLGKVDKLCTCDCKQIRELRDLFNDDMIFIACCATERFPEDGFEVDVHNYKITPYRDLKRPCGLKRSSSLRTPRHRRESGGDGDLQRPARPVKRSSSVKSAGHSRNRSQSPGPRPNGHPPRGYRPKSPGSSSGRKTPTGSTAASDELYPAQVFEKDPSDSVKKNQKLRKQRISVHGFYRIGKVIGDGNFAVVRECKHRKTNEEYALKIISKAKVKGKEHMVENEIKILRRVKHDNIVELIEEYETPKEIFLVMELLKGGDLFEAIVRATKYTEEDASNMIRDLASALEYLHNLNIVHRDIKPENLLVFDTLHGTKSVKLADFGLAMEVKSPMFLVCGTPTYVAPEILDESGYGLKVDIWAAGVICYILLCGFPPFRSPDQDDLFDQILAGEFEYLSPFWDDISHSAKDLIEHMLVVDANRRYSAKQVLHHPWISGHTANTKDIHVKLKHELTKNFDAKKRLKGAAIAVQTVKYLGMKCPYPSSKGGLTKSQELLIEINDHTSLKRCISRSHEASIDTDQVNGRESECHPKRHVSSPEILSPTRDTKYFTERITGTQWVQFAQTESVSYQGELTRQHNPATGFSRSDQKRRAVKRKASKVKAEIENKTKERMLPKSDREEHTVTVEGGKGGEGRPDNIQIELTGESSQPARKVSLDYYIQRDLEFDINSESPVPDIDLTKYTAEYLSGKTEPEGEGSLSLCGYNNDNVDVLLSGAIESECFSKLTGELEKLTFDLYTQPNDVILEEDDDTEYY